MNFKSKMRQKAVYWPPAAVDRRGQKGYGTPVEIDCHWEDNQEVRVNKTGNEWMSKTQVLTDHPIKEEGRLLLHALDGSINADPMSNAGTVGIGEVGITPSVQADQTLYEAFL